MPVTVVVGPPCAGKTTYVQANAKPGDLIVDHDLIAQAFGATDSHDAAGLVREAAFAARSAAIDAALKAGDGWVIHTKPNPGQINRYARAGARFVVVDPGQENCLERAKSDRPERTPGVIRDWYQNPPVSLPRASTTRGTTTQHQQDTGGNPTAQEAPMPQPETPIGPDDSALPVETTVIPDDAEAPDPQEAVGEPEVFDRAYVEKLRAENAKYRLLAKANQDAANKAGDLEAQHRANEAKIAELEARAASQRLAIEHGLSAEDCDLLAKLPDQESREELAARLAANRQASPRNPAPVPELGRVITTDSDNAARFARTYEKL